MEISNTVARQLLLVLEPIPVLMRNSKGNPLDDDGRKIDERCLAPWTWALGPYGSWPCTVEDALEDFTEERPWFVASSMRLGPVVSYRDGWGYATKQPAVTEVDWDALSFQEVLTLLVKMAGERHVADLLRSHGHRRYSDWPKVDAVKRLAAELQAALP